MRAALAITLLALGLTAAPAAAQEERKTDRRGDLRAPGLTAAERRAMDIRAVTVYSDGDGLVIVDLRLAGNLERRIGRGHLRRAAAGVFLRPASGRASVVGTIGSAREARGATRGPADRALVARHGTLLRFIVTGVQTPRSVLAMTAPRVVPRDGRATAAEEDDLTRFFRLLTPGGEIPVPTDRVTVPGIEPARPSCKELRAMRARLEDERAALTRRRNDAEKPDRRIQQAINTLDIELAGLKQAYDARCAARAPESFSTTWTHGTGRSRICVYVRGEPGDGGDVDGGTGEPPRSFVLDAAGRATVFVEISSRGVYLVTVRWRQPDGSTRTAGQPVTVSEQQGPPPPEGFAPCPPP